MTATLRKIIHCDCDCFYAAIETRDTPAYTGKPLAVGGNPERRGVVATCNYEARKFGIHSAMPMATALRHCPELIVVYPRMEQYRQASLAVHDIFRDYTHLIEPLSLDEAYLDVTDASACKGSATLIAQEIRRRVREEIGITISAGIAPNKFIAKVASDWNKPDGQYVVEPAQVDAFVKALPVKKIFGVGKVTAGKLHALGVQNCEELRTFSTLSLTEHFGSFGDKLYRLCRGIDERPVNPQRIRKSLSVENTYVTDLPDLQSCLAQLPQLHEQLESRLRQVTHDYYVSKKYLKIKFSDFVSTTIETLSCDTALQDYNSLCGEAFARGNRSVRLLGLGVKLEPIAEQNTKPSIHTMQLPLRLE